MDKRKRIRIGDLLIEHKFISETQLENALAEQKKTRRKLGKTLIDLGYIEEYQLLELLSKQLGITYSDLRLFDIDLDVLHRLPEIFARRFRAIALKEENGNVVIGMADPTDIYAYDEIQKVLKQPLQIVAISEGDLLHN
ncbi:MAG TPA: MSHA biogenesis protein MshE, partial [Methylophaga sp.]|nr:MSHA biogenesis protein MshE [Methylophaga sp.]